jgi:hypothetical protein
VSTATPHIFPKPCEHERRPGTTVCLHCRHAARLAAQARHRRLFLRTLAIAIVLGTAGMAGVFGATAIREHNAHRDDTEPTQTVTTGAEIIPVSTGVADQGAATPPGDTSQLLQTGATARKNSIAATPSTAATTEPGSTNADASTTAAARTKQVAAAPVAPAPAPAVTPSAPPLAPILPFGQSPLRDGIVAQRSESAVLLSFDNPDNRTRMPAKFEQFVRATLPQVYGAAADSALSHIPVGALARQGDLLTELPVHGMHIPLKGGWAIALYPETRVGRDGPLVVRYHTRVAR